MPHADRIRSALRAAADPARAAGQQAYMKSGMPFYGVRVPEARRIALRESSGITDASALVALARQLWDEASHREERYAAIAVLASPALRGDPAVVPAVEQMVRTGRWWDYTDALNGRIADLLDERPVETAGLVRAWSTDADLWIRRVAILAQLGRKERTDPDLLAEAIEPNLSDREFFIRKAIGWALRDYARTAPEWVRTYVDAHAMSGLSRREALKHL